MAEQLDVLINGTKKELYQNLLPQLASLLDGETDIIANLANITSSIKHTFNYFWVGFYLVKGDELVLGPFQGTLACTRIKYGRGVCGTAWANKETIIVANVDNFPGHIACDSASKSEIVVPIFKANNVVAILDVDSNVLDTFDKIDAEYLEDIVKLIKF